MHHLFFAANDKYAFETFHNSLSNLNDLKTNYNQFNFCDNKSDYENKQVIEFEA